MRASHSLGVGCHLECGNGYSGQKEIKDTPEAISYEIPFEGWSCYIGTRKIIKQWQLTLREHLNGNPLCQHWQHKQKFGKSARPGGLDLGGLSNDRNWVEPEEMGHKVHFRVVCTWSQPAAMEILNEQQMPPLQPGSRR